MDYDTWKLMTPEEADGSAYDKYVPVEVEVLIFDLGQNIIDEFKNETSNITFEDGETTLTTTITVDALLTCDDFEKECYVEEENIKDAVAEYLGNDCEYEIIDWRRA